jgi:hypothetical protein
MFSNNASKKNTTAKILVTLQNGEQVTYLLTKENGA